MGETDYPTAADWASSAAHDAQRGVDALAREFAALKRDVAPRPAPTRLFGHYSDPKSSATIERNLSYHPAATPERQAQHEAVREACRRLAHALDRIVPPGRHKALAQTAVEDAMHWANAGVATQLDPVPAPEPAPLPEGELVPAGDETETLHVLPTSPDLIDHETGNGPACPCGPTLEPQSSGGLLIIHNAADGRA